MADSIENVKAWVPAHDTGVGRYRFYREHKYVCHVLHDLDSLIAKTDFGDESALVVIRDRFSTLAAMLKSHAEYEERAIHILLEEKGSRVCDSIEMDHRRQDAELLSLKAQLEQVSACSDPEQREFFSFQFYLSYRLFVSTNLKHLYDEETIVLPELQRLYSDQELKKVEAATYSHMTPEEMRHMTDVLFPHMNSDDQKAFLDDIRECEPQKYQEAFSSAVGIRITSTTRPELI